MCGRSAMIVSWLNKLGPVKELVGNEYKLQLKAFEEQPSPTPDNCQRLVQLFKFVFRVNLLIDGAFIPLIENLSKFEEDENWLKWQQVEVPDARTSLPGCLKQMTMKEWKDRVKTFEEWRRYQYCLKTS